MICTTLNHLGCDEILSIGFLMSARCAYSKKYCKIFCTNLSVDLEISRGNIFGSVPEIGHKEMLLITLVETIINMFSRDI